MSAVCPKCGVAVVPGYVKCPKCQTALPQRRASTSVSAGGTSVGGGSLSPTLILIAVAVVGAGIAVFALRGGGSDKPAPVETPSAVVTPEDPTARPVAEPDETPTPTAAQPVANDPTIAVRDLDRALKKERLWGTVEVNGSGVDVRSGGCREATMMPVVEAAIPALREAGVTKVRCLEQAGAVVFEREL